MYVHHEYRSQYLVKERIVGIILTDPHDQCKRVAWPQKKKCSLGLSLGAKLVSTIDRPPIFSIIFRLFPRGGLKKKCTAFCTIRLDVLQGMSVESFAQKNEDLTYPCSRRSRIQQKKWILH